MSLVFWIIIGIISVFFITTTLWIFFNFFKNSKRDYNLYKSVSKSVFARKLSLIIIVIFYMISFGLVGGLTSAVGRLNKEGTDYIKQNHLHQGVARQTYFNKDNKTTHTFDQKSFYLATQGVIDFYNEYVYYSSGINPEIYPRSTFINMLGGQDVNDDGIVTLKEKLDGSTSPLSYQSNEGGSTVYAHKFSIHDIGQFWNLWYYGSDFIITDPTIGDDPAGVDHWKTYRYNGNDNCSYNFNDDGHKKSPILEKVEEFANNTIFYDHNKDTEITFEDLIDDENNGLDTFSKVVFALFDNNINKYFSTVGTFFFEYYLNLYDEKHDNLFASSRVFEYQETILGTDYLLQSYSKNEVTSQYEESSNSPLNNLGTDKHGDYAVDSVTFYNNKGKEIAGPSQEDPFFKPHAGTKSDPYQVYISTEFYEANNLDQKVGQVNIPRFSGYDFYYEIKGSYRSPTYSFPMQTVSSSLQKPESNAAILINTQSLLRLTREHMYSTTNYEFLGFSNIYDATTKSSDWFYSPFIAETNPDDTFYMPYTMGYAYLVNNFYGDSSWNNIEEDLGDSNYPQTYSLNVESINKLTSTISYRSFTIIREVAVDKVIFSVIMGVFLIITIIVLILLIRKRIQDSSKQIGTIKALGYGPGRIASAYTLFPIIIIICGGIMALIVALPLSLWFTSLYGGFFSLNLMTPYIGIMFWIKIFIFPLIVSMFIGYWMAYHTIKKPTIDLLNNVDSDKPNWLVRGTSHLIPPFASFEFTYKSKGIGRAFFKSLLLFGAILGSMSITSFAFASSTMTATMTKEVFDIIDYEGKKWEFGAPFIEDININDVGENYKYNDVEMECFDLFSSPEQTNLNNNQSLIFYLTKIFRDPNEALNEFVDLLPTKDFDFSFSINYDEDEETSPSIISNYYIDWKTAVALWATNIALHVPMSNGNANPDLNTPIMEFKENSTKDNELFIDGPTITFNMLDPILSNYAVNVSANIVVRYGKDLTFEVIHFIDKIINDYINLEAGSNSDDLKNDLIIAWNWIILHSNDFPNGFKIALDEEYIFNDIVFNKNYYDGVVKNGDDVIDSSQEINQTMTTAYSGYFFKTNLKGDLITNDRNETFYSTTTYMEGYSSTEELTATNNIGDVAIEHIKDPSEDNVVNVAMTQSESKEVKRYKEATPSIQKDLDKNQARIFVKTKVWDTNLNTYKEIYIPVVFDIEIYDSIYPLGSFFLQDDLDQAINYSLTYLPDYTKFKNETWYPAYETFMIEELKIAEEADFEHNYSVTYNIDTSGEEFKTAPFSVSLSQNGLISLIDQGEYSDIDGGEDPFEIELAYMVNNFYIPFQIPLSIDIIIEQGSRVYELLQGILYIVAFFALFIGVTIVMIAMKDIMDSNKREVSMFKAFGYSNGRATSLVITPYIFVMACAFIIAIPISLLFLSTIGTILTLTTGTTYVFALVIWQWIVVVGFIIGLVIFLSFVGYKSYQHTNALEAISETNE